MKGDLLGDMSKRGLPFRALAEELVLARKLNTALHEANGRLRQDRGTPVGDPEGVAAQLQRASVQDLVERLLLQLREQFAPNTEEELICIAAAQRLLQLAIPPKPVRKVRASAGAGTRPGR